MGGKVSESRIWAQHELALWGAERCSHSQALPWEHCMALSGCGFVPSMDSRECHHWHIVSKGIPTLAGTERVSVSFTQGYGWPGSHCWGFRAHPPLHGPCPHPHQLRCSNYQRVTNISTLPPAVQCPASGTHHCPAAKACSVPGPS